MSNNFYITFFFLCFYFLFITNLFVIIILIEGMVIIICRAISYLTLTVIYANKYLKI
nr:MAG TPA: hypothetical protein [Caudoviricetes sp.]